MKYENHPVPDHINVSAEHPLKDFFILLLGLGGAVVAVVVLLALLAERMVVYIPFSVEESLAKKFLSDEELVLQQSAHTDVAAYLQSLANKLAEVQELPDGMTITVHYADDDVINAFATLGGHIIIHRGLLERMPSENALAMVIAHEISHIKNRHPIIAMGRGITVSLALMSLAGLSDSAVFDQFTSMVGAVASLSFSREHERQADAEALETLLGYYGHAQGADGLFAVFNDLQGNAVAPEFLSTHPQSKARLETVRRFQGAHPAAFSQALRTIPATLLNTDRRNENSSSEDAPR